MQIIPRWRNISLLKSSLIQSIKTGPGASPYSPIDLVSFHSTSIHSEKWKKHWDYNEQRSQKPTKKYIKYETRRKRADAKKALKHLLFNYGCLKKTIEEWDVEQANCFGKSRKKHKCRRKEASEDYDEYTETTFNASFGGKWYTWSFKSWEDSFRGSASKSNWRKHTNWTNNGNNTASGTDSDNESCNIGLFSDRKILGLPSTGPLTMDEVKKAFRLSALKWHPDKHQGPSQAMAEEKFKHCANSYKSLCDALSAA